MIDGIINSKNMELKDLKKRRSSVMSNKVNKETEKMILNNAIKFSVDGPKRIYYELKYFVVINKRILKKIRELSSLNTLN